MTTNTPPAQAGDETMRAAFEVAMPARYPRDRNMRDKSYNSPYMHIAWEVWQIAQAVSPRATADVERNLRIELVNAGALRQYCHNDGSAGFVTAYDFDITNRFLAAIATTKPGA